MNLFVKNDKKLILTRKELKFEKNGLLLLLSFGKIDGVFLKESNKKLTTLIGSARMTYDDGYSYSIIIGPIRLTKIVKYPIVK